MSIARGLTKAASAAKKQSRGLKGNRNSQGDFMPEDVQMKGVQDAVAPDIQNYINDVKKQIDDIDNEITSIDTNVDAPGLQEYMASLEAKKEKLLDDLITKLEENNIPVPEEVRDLKLQPYDRELKQRDDVMREEELGKEAENLRIRKLQQSPDYEWTPGEWMA